MSKYEPYSIELDESSPALSQNRLVGSKEKKSFLERMKEREKRQNKVKLSPRIPQENYSKKSSNKAKSLIDNLNTSPVMKKFIKEEFEREKVKYSFLPERQVQLQVIQKYKSDIASAKRKSTKKQFKSGDSGFLDEGFDIENYFQRNKSEKRIPGNNNGRQKEEFDSENDAEIMGYSSQYLYEDCFIKTPGLLQKSQEKAELVRTTTSKTAFHTNPMYPLRETLTNFEKKIANSSKMITKRKSPEEDQLLNNSLKEKISNASVTKQSSKKKSPKEDSSILSKKCTGTPFGDGKTGKSVKFLSQPLYDSDELPEKMEIRKAAKTKSIVKPATPIKSGRVLKVTKILNSQSPPIKSPSRRQSTSSGRVATPSQGPPSLLNTSLPINENDGVISLPPILQRIEANKRELKNKFNEIFKERFEEQRLKDEERAMKKIERASKKKIQSVKNNEGPIRKSKRLVDKSLEGMDDTKLSETPTRKVIDGNARKLFNTPSKKESEELVDDMDKCSEKQIIQAMFPKSEITVKGSPLNKESILRVEDSGEEENGKVNGKKSEIEIEGYLVEGQYNQVAESNVPSTDAEETPHNGKMVKNQEIQDVKLDQVFSPDLNSSMDLFSDVEDMEDFCDNRESVGGSFQTDIKNQTESVLKSRKPMTSGTEVTVIGSPLIDGSFESTSSKKSITDDLYSTLCWNEFDSKPHTAKFQVYDCLSPENPTGRNSLQSPLPPVKVDLAILDDCIVLSDDDVNSTKPQIGAENNVSSDMFSGGEDVDKIEIALATTEEEGDVLKNKDILGSEYIEDFEVFLSDNKKNPQDISLKLQLEILSYPSSDDLFSEDEVIEMESSSDNVIESSGGPSQAENESPTKKDKLECEIISPELEAFSDNEDIVEDVSQRNDGFLCDLFSEVEEADVPMESSQDSETTEDEENYKIF